MKAIFATTQNYLLGIGGTMPWCHSEDYKELGKMDMDYFKEITKDSKVVMGYNTWVSIGQKPLKGRKEHYIITSKKDLSHDDSRVRFVDLKTFVKKYSKDKDLVCIGGGQIYKELLPYYTEIYWNELRMEEKDLKDIMKRFDNKVFLSRKIVHVLDNPVENNYREGSTVMTLDSKGNTITFKRLIKKATP